MLLSISKIAPENISVNPIFFRNILSCYQVDLLYYSLYTVTYSQMHPFILEHTVKCTVQKSTHNTAQSFGQFG